MTTTEENRVLRGADAFGCKVAARLSAGLDELPYEINERLRAARARALPLRKRLHPPQASMLARRAAAPSLGDEKLSLWQRVASVLPLVVLVGGLVLIHGMENEYRASELAEVDVALLTDDLPPAAYADPGFVQFLKTHRE